ncbi:flavin reductase [Desulfuromonas sp. AOP6]|uniref:flavin reductase n=1 Tax=Desulfuromonas sp. AOP6 TaxID=1566351 RepID=UPI00127B0573|nr:flavin reductase [Desulfuromonas sp. AOP6]BCA78719.1 hypothetical protein AOP6_0506 [Desulfuromonas sp. AOP6]
MSNLSSLDPAFYPTPAALVTFNSPQGKTCLLPSPWMGVVWCSPPLLTLAFRHGCATRPLMQGVSRFVVNLPPDSLLDSSPLITWLMTKNPDMECAPELTPWHDRSLEITAIDECPVQLVCDQPVLNSRYGQDVLSGRVVALYADKSPVSMAEALDFGRYTSGRR